MTGSSAESLTLRWRNFALPLGLALLSIDLAACGGASAGSGNVAAKTATPPSVDVVSVTASTLSTIVSLPGELQPYETVPIFPRVNGFVRSLSVDRGSHVRQGQVIARLEAPELISQRAEAQAKLQTAQAQLAAAEARLASDDATYQRLKAASATPGVVAGNDVETAQKAVETDRALVRAQNDTVAAAKEALQSIAEIAGYLEVKAPFDGVVTERNTHPGALVGPAGAASGADPMLRIDTVSRLRLIVPVPESYLAGVRENRSVEFSVPAYPGRTFMGTIARIAHAVSVKTRTMPVELDVPNPSAALTPGSFAEVRWPVERPEPTLFVPPSAVASTLERTFVVRIRDRKSEWVDVKTGVTTGKLVEVFGNLRAGDEVAVRGTDELRPGTTVTPRQAPR